jgi:predicted RNA binding protein YcfA (HicA-like mRNA interferase family)
VKALSGKAFCLLLERHGWQLLRVQGSHHVYGKPGQRARISVPVRGTRPLKCGLQRHLPKLAGIAEEEVP